MSPAISYFIFSSNGSYLRWDDDTNIDFLIRQYQMSITGGGGVDRLYVGAGTKVDAGALFASANTDELYFSGNFSDYAQTISAGGVYTFTGLAGGSHANEVVSFSMNSNGDKLVFANGHVTVKSSDYLSVSGSYSSISAGSLTIVAQTDPNSGAQPGNKPAKVFVFDAGGINIPQLPIVGEAIAVSGGGGVDKFYVRKGTHADAIGLFASAGVDVLYLTGRFNDYTQTKSAGGVYTFTRNFTGADASLTEVVNFSMNSSGDQLVFADGGVTLRLADYLSGGSYADITAAQLNPLIITPGLLAPTPNLILASDTGSSASDRITNNATINVTGLVTGGTWQYQVDGTAAGSWTTGTASSLIASSGAHTYFVRQFDMAGLSSGVSTAATYTLDTSPPSGLMVLATSGNVAENTLGAVTLIANANDMPASTSVTWSLGTGLDSALFNITSAGVLSFKTAPNYEMPRGSAFNAASNNDAYTVNVIATDAAGNASAPSAIVVNVSDVNEAPVAVGIISSRAATKNVAFSYDVSRFFSDPDTQASNAAWHTLTYTATGLPSGLTIDDSTGVISGTATAVQVASAITVTASDGGGGSGVTQTFDLEVFNGPVLSDFNVTDSVGNANFGKSGDELTLVVTMSEAVTVTPASDLGIPFSLSMTFSVNGQSTSADYTSGSGSNILTFMGGSVPVNNGSAISITSIELQRGTVTGNVSMQNWITTHTGQIYAGYTVDNTPPAAPILMLASDTGISASDSLTNNATILVSGLETTVGTSWQYQVDSSAWATGTSSSLIASSGAHTYLVRQIDAAGNTSAASAPVTYTVDNTAPTVNATTFSVAENTTAVGTLAANETVTWSLGSGADTSRFNLTNGVLSFSVAPDFEMPRGSAFDAASNNNAYTVNVTATDTAGNVKAQAIVVNVTDVNEAPTVIAPIVNQTVVVNQSFSLDVFRSFSDPDSLNRYPSGTPNWGTLTYTATGLPSGLSIAPDASDISGAAIATTASAASVTVTATDGGGLSVTTTFNLSVIAVPTAPVVQSFIAKDTVGNPFTGKSGEPLFFVLTMNEPVVVNTHSTPSHAPTIVFSVNGHDVTVTYSAGTGTNILTFTGGTVPTGDGHHITLTTINLNGADVTGTLSGQVWLTTSTGQVHDNYPVDNTAPTVSKTTFSVAENTLDVATGFRRLSSNENAVTWALVTGANAAADNSFFTLPDSGDLRFTNAPNFEMPRGSAFNAASNNDAYTINVTATDLVGNVGTQVLVVNVTDVNEAPTLTLPARGATSVLLNQAANLNVSGDFSDPDSVNTYAVGTPQWGTLTYTTTGLPAGLSINASTGVISGTATATTASAASVTVTATDGGNMSITETFSLSVVSAPTLSTATPPSTALTGGGNSIGDTIVLTITFDGVVNGLTTGTDNTIFKVAGTGVSATWNGTTGTATRTLTYTVVAGQNGQATLDEVALKTVLVAGITDAAGSAFVYTANGGTIAAIDSTALPVIDGTAPTLSSTAPSTVLNGGGDGVGDTIVLTITFDGAVNGLTTGTDDTIFKVAGTGVSATWSGTTGATTRTLTYTVAAGQNGQVTLDEAALKTVLVAGISDAAGNAFVYTANGGTIANIDSPALPVISTVAAAAPTLAIATPPSTALTGGGNSIGDTIVLTITFDGAVSGLTSGTNNTIFKVAGIGVSATWSGTTGATTRTLTYTVVAGQNGQATLDEVALKTALVEGITNAAGSAFVYTANGGTIADIDSTALPVIDGTAPTLSSTAPSTTLTGGGDGVGDTIVLTITFDGAVNGLTTGTDDTIFKVAGTGVSATWSGTTGATTRTLTYTVAAGQNGQVTLDEAALKTVLVAGITDAAGNAFVYTANGGTIANIDSPALPVISTVAAAAPTLAIATPPSTALTGGGNSIGDTIVLTITFDGAVSGLTSGTNNTIFKVAGIGVSATWSGTTGATTRTLTYTVVAGQNGQATLDEVALKTALVEGITNAAGSAFVYTANGGTIADIDSTALPVIDGTAPTLSSTAPSTTLTGGGDGVGDTIVLTITFDGAVNGLTTGTDDTIFKVAGTGVSATWSGTTGATTRTLTYTVAAGQNGQVTLDEAALKTVLVAGISDAAGNAFVYTANGGTIANIDSPALPVISTVAAAAPTLAIATPPSTALTGGGNSIGDTIVLTITFDGVVNGLTTGTDNTIFKVAGTGVSATWSGATGTATRTLTYTVAAGQNGQATLDEVALKTALIAGITNAAGSAFVYSGTIADIDSPALPVIDGTAPATPSLTLASDTGSSASDGLTNNVTINVSGLETGATWQYQVDGSGSWATGTASSFTAGSGAHTYLVRQTDAAGNTSVTSTAATYTLDTTAPTLSSTAPSTTLTGGGDGVGDTIVLTITFDGAVNGLTTGTDDTIFKVAGTGVSATWSGTTGATTRTLTYTVAAGQNGQVTLDEAALKTVLVAGISDAAGNAFVYTANGGTIANIDSPALPVISTVAAAAPTLAIATPPSTALTGGGNSIGDTIVLTITFDGAVSGLTSGTDSTIFKVAGIGVSATWSGTTGATTRTLTYTVVAGQNGQATLDEAALKTVLVAGITNAAGSAFVYSGTIADIDSTALPVIDGTAPTLSSTAPSTVLNGGGDGVGDTIVLTITFDGAVNGLTTGTDDTIFKVAGTGVSATWSGTTGATTRTLTYTVAAGQNGQVTLDEAALKTVLVAGISDAAGNAFVYTANGGTIANIDSPALPVISTVAAAAPTLAIATPPSTALTGGGNSIGDTIVLTITFDGAVSGLTSGTDSTIFKVAGIGVSATWSGTTGATTRTLTYTVVAGQNGQATLDEAALKTVLVAGITNAAGSAFVYSGTIAAIDSTALPVIDGTAPTLSSTAPSTVLNGGGDGVGDTIVLTITFDGAVNGLTTGTDDTIFKVAGTGVSATWSGTTGATTRTLTYTVAAGQNGQVTLDEAALKTVLVAGISDAAGNAFVYTANGGTIANIDSPALPVISTVAAAAPTLAIATPPSTALTGGGNSIGDTIVLTITFDGAVSGLTSGTDSTIFKVAGIGVSATWSGTTGATTRTLTYTVVAGQNGQATLDEAALKTVLVAGITNAAGSAFVYSGTIAAIDSTALPVIDGTAPTLSSTAPSTVLNGGGDGVGDTIVLTITFDGAVNGLTTGTDDTIFKVAGTGVSATWSGTTGATTRTLTYTVAAGQNGQVTLDEAALKTVLVAGISDAAGNAFVYTANGGTIANIDSPALPVISTVAAAAPTLAIATPPSTALTGGGNSIGDTIVLTITFDGAVSGLTSGTDSTIFKVAGIGVSATWSGTTGATTRTLTYTVVAGQNGQATLDEAALKTVLVAGITNAAGSAFVYSGTIADIDSTALPVIDGTAPTLSSTAPSTVLNGGGDGVGDTIVLTITFDGAVNGLTTGTDDTIFKVAGTGVSATWSGTTGTATRTLTYTVAAGQNGQVTLDEAALKTVLVAGISDAAGNAFVYTANSGNIANIDSTPLPVVSTVAAAAPTLAIATPPSTTLNGGGNSIGDTIVLTITFDGAVNGLTSGTNSTIFKVAGTGVSATWSGTTGATTRTLTYTVVAGQNGQATLDEVALKTALVEGITNAAGSAFVYSGTIADIDSTALPVIDGTAPTLSSTAPSTTLTNGGDGVGDTIVLTITFDGAVNGLTTGTDDTIFKVAGAGVSATWSGTTGATTRTLTYTVAAGQNGQVTLDEAALKTVLVAGISDAAGNAFVYTANSGNIANIDSTPLPVVSTVAAAAPTLSAVTSPSTTLNGGGNSIGDTIVLTITFDGAVNGLTSGTNSTIFKVAGTGVSATWSGTTGATTRTLTYTVVAGQNGQATLDEVALKTALVEGITNAAGSAFVYSGTIAAIDSTALPVIDGTAPTLSSTAPSTNLTGGGDGVGDTIVLTITFDGAVNGLTTGTDDTIFKVAGTGVSATWSGTTGTATRTLTYTVAAGQNGQVTLDEAALKTVLVAGISDAAGNAFVYTANSGNIANIDSTPLPVVSTVAAAAPTLAIATPPSTTLNGGGNSIGDTIVLTITFDGAVNGLTSGTNSTIFKVAGTGVSATWSGTTGATTRTLTYTVVAGQNGQATLDEVALKTALVEGITNAAGSAFVYSGTIADIDSTALPVIDGTAPTLSSTAPSTNLTGGGDGVGDTIVLTITFDGAVNGLTTGTDDTIFKVAGTGVSATWSGTTGTATRTLTYTVAAGQNGQVTLDEAALKTVLVAGITDAAGNAFVYTANSGTIANIDSTPLPVVSTVAAAAPALVASPSLDNVTNLDVTSALVIAFDYLYDSSLGIGSSTAASNYRSANGLGVYAGGTSKSTLMQTDYPRTTEDGNMDLGIETDYRLGYNAVIFG